MHGRDRIAVIIEDDPDIRRLLEEVLEQGGFEIHSAGNGLDGVQKVRRYNPTLTTLDVSMPGIDGFETAKRIRAFSDTYLIMLTARNDEIDALMGLGAGADDYVAKPFRPRELRARIDAMLRRPRGGSVGGQRDAARPAPVADPGAAASDPGVAASHPGAGAGHSTVSAPVATTQAPEYQPPAFQPVASHPPEAQPVAPAPPAPHGAVASDRAGDGDGWLEHRGLRLEPEMHLVNLDGEELDLTRSEFELLHLLMVSKRRVRSKADLALALRGESYVTAYYVSEADKRGVEVHLANLRRKLGENAAQPRWIETVRGVGYRLTADDAA